MPKSVSESVRQRVIEITSQQGVAFQLKSNDGDQYVKNLMFYSKTLDQTVYIQEGLLELLAFLIIFKLLCIRIFLARTGYRLRMAIKSTLTSIRKRTCISA